MRELLTTATFTLIVGIISLVFAVWGWIDGVSSDDFTEVVGVFGFDLATTIFFSVVGVLGVLISFLSGALASRRV